MFTVIRDVVHPIVHNEGEPPITGVPSVSVTVSNIAQPNIAMIVEATVDTGFTAHLTLPAKVIQELELPYYGDRLARLADGEIGRFNVYAARVSWNGQSKITPIFESESQPLLGMAMIWGNRLVVDARAGGEVTIE